jgi:hypothetical protein
VTAVGFGERVADWPGGAAVTAVTAVSVDDAGFGDAQARKNMAAMRAGQSFFIAPQVID